jgi:hypothetical protein
MLRATGVAVLLVLVVGGLVGCGPSGGTILKVGECVNFEPSDEGESTVKVDCAQPHDQEVFYAFDMPDGDYPGLFEIGDAQQDECTSAFAEFVGIPWEQSHYTYTFDAPTEETWDQGARTITCLLEDNSGLQLTGSARGTAR